MERVGGSARSKALTSVMTGHSMSSSGSYFPYGLVCYPPASHVYPSSTELPAPAISHLAKRIFMQKVKKPIQVSVYTEFAKSSLPM